MAWWIYALASACAAAATALLAKVGVAGVPTALATALRTIVILVVTWAIALGLGQHHAWPSVSRRSLFFLALSGVATGLSWLAYFKALQLAPVSWVGPLDKLSLPISVLLAAVVLGESVSWQTGAGVTLIVVGALLTRA